MKEKDTKLNIEELAKITETNNKAPNFLFSLIGFIIPPFGYVLYCLFENKNPKRARSTAWGSFLGCVFYLILVLVFILFIMEEKQPLE